MRYVMAAVALAGCLTSGDGDTGQRVAYLCATKLVTCSEDGRVCAMWCEDETVCTAGDPVAAYCDTRTEQCTAVCETVGGGCDE